MLHLLAFITVCAIVMYACIAFRDDDDAVDAWGSSIHQTDLTTLTDEAAEFGDDDGFDERYTCSFESGFRRHSSSVKHACTVQAVHPSQRMGAVGRS